MNPRIPKDIEQAITANPNGAVQVEDSKGIHYWIISEDTMNIRTHVQAGIQEANAGNITKWNAADIKKMGRELSKKATV